MSLMLSTISSDNELNKDSRNMWLLTLPSDELDWVISVFKKSFLLFSEFLPNASGSVNTSECDGVSERVDEVRVREVWRRGD